MSRASPSNPTNVAAARIVDKICDRFERAWQQGAATLEEFLAEAPADVRQRLLVELAAIELHYRRQPQAGTLSIDDFVAAHSALADELQACAAELDALAAANPTNVNGAAAARRRSAWSDVWLVSGRESQGLHIRCPHCASPVELLADTPFEDVTCHACGSTFCLVDRDDSPAAAPTLRKIGRFELTARLGVGGFGAVWKARDPELDRVVAIKIPRKGQLRAEEIDFFFREARAAAQLRHPHIVAVHEIGREDDSVFIVSDFVRGETLAQRMATEKPTVRETAELGAVIADALQHAHERGVVHRDLKPSNIMIDEDGQPRIMDFGLAKRDAGEVTMTCEGQILGTAAYMSPEQAGGQGHWTDRRADVYSLGVILFQLAAGELPYRGTMEMQLVGKQYDDAPDPRKLNKRIPRDFATICLKCLERNPNGRYASAAALAAELRRFLSGEPILARPLSKPRRMWRWAKRKPALATAAALAALVAVAGPTAALVINSQRVELADNLKEQFGLVSQAETDKLKLGKRIQRLEQDLKESRGLDPGIVRSVPELRRTVIADLVDRHYAASAKAERTDAESRAQLDLAWGMMLAEIGRTGEAIDRLSSAQSALERLAEQHPDELRYRAALADCYDQLSDLHRAAGHADLSQQTAMQAVEARKALAELHPEDAAAHLDVVASLFRTIPDAGSFSPATLKAQMELTKGLIDALPSDAAGIYEAACRLTLRTPVLTLVADEPSPKP